MTEGVRWEIAIQSVHDELDRASAWPAPNSAHEGFAILLEEVDELKAWVWTNQRKRNPEKMRYEAIQVAAMAIRFAAQCRNDDWSRR